MEHRREGRGSAPAVDTDAFALVALDEEVGPDLAAVDWSGTPLGPPEGWPQSLRTALSTVLSSRFSMWMAWGPDLTFFCNAAYRRDTLGRKYPRALGRPSREVWAEIWDEIGPRIETVLHTGRATWDEALLLFLERSGYQEETYHTFSYSPLRDEAGAVAGMLCVVTEDTERVVSEHRMATLRDLGSDPMAVRTEQEVLEFTARQLGRNRNGFPFTLVYLFEQDGSARLAASSGIAEGHSAAPAVLPAGRADGLWPTAAAARGESALVRLEGAAARSLPAGDRPLPPAEALVVPLPQQGAGPYGFLVAGLNRHRPLDDGYRTFVTLVAGHIAAGVGGARAYQAQQRRAEELAELDRAKTAFFSNISHEFRTPLTLISGPLEELRASLVDPDPRTRENLELIRRNEQRLGRLVNTLLDFSRIEAGRLRARYVPVDLALLTTDLASNFRSAIETAGLAFQVECRPLPEPVYVDRELWEKVVLNLLSNALKYTIEGSVRVRVHAEGQDAVVAVSDTGIGVPEQELPRLFERFHRIENARARSTEGSGIGLAFVKELVALHGGTVDVVSAPGRGTTFTVRIPFGAAHLPQDAVARPEEADLRSSAADAFVQEALRWLPVDTGRAGTAGGAEPAGIVPADRPARRPISGSPISVLIVDDNADMREYLSGLTRGAGHDAIAVADGDAALAAARTSPPDLIISDVMMPGISGLRLVAALRAEPRTAGIAVILLSARAGQEAAIEGLEAGADDYLVKPFSAAELLARVRANVQLVRMRTRQARWRAALVDSLQDAFFACDEHGAIIEINAAFTDILGYGPEGLPYPPERPWWPDPAVDPEAHRLVAAAFELFRTRERGVFTVPVTHRDGRRVWITVSFNEVLHPETGRRVSVGTLRDSTAEHYAVRRDAAVAAISVRLSQSADLEQALSGVVGELHSLWRADRVLGVVFGRDGGTPLVAATPAEAAWPALDPDLRGVLARLREGPPLVAPADPDVPGGVGISLEHPRGRLVLWLDLSYGRPVTDDDRALLSVLAGHLSQGLARAHQIDQQRETAMALQHAILGPARLPAGFAVRYEPAARPLEVGGDWYDTVPLEDGRIGIVVGDCVGRGLKAAAVMGQLRSACRALLLQDPRPGHVLAALDRFAAAIPEALCTTVFCGVLDPGTGVLTYSSAGHPPGIVASPDGGTHLLEHALSMPLAVRLGGPRPCARYTIVPRATLLLYTDGLVERRHRVLTEGIEQAGRALHTERATGLDGLAVRVMAHLAPRGGYEDDVALLLYRRPGPFVAELAPGPGQVAAAAEELRGWLLGCGVAPETAVEVLAAARQACTEAAKGADTSSAPLVLRAEAFAGHITVAVADLSRTVPIG